MCAEPFHSALAGRGGDRVPRGAGHTKVRERAQRAFMTDDASVVVATSAFGMGIDKPDVRWVLHAQVAESPDEYDQRGASGPAPFRAEPPVTHPTFGAGVVMSLDGDAVTVLFQEVGYRTLSVPTVLEHHLLTSPASP